MAGSKGDQGEDNGDVSYKKKILDIFAEDSHDDSDKSDISDQESLSGSDSRKSSSQTGQKDTSQSPKSSKLNSSSVGSSASAENLESDSVHENSFSDSKSTVENGNVEIDADHADSEEYKTHNYYYKKKRSLKELDLLKTDLLEPETHNASRRPKRSKIEEESTKEPEPDAGAPPKRTKGRPRKSKTKAESLIESVVESETPMKSLRGRTGKFRLDDLDEDLPVKKPIGRPKKGKVKDIERKRVDSEQETAVKKPIGRPKKRKPDSEDSTSLPEQERSPKSPVGRPRKCKMESNIESKQDSESIEISAVKPKKMGRPRKVKIDVEEVSTTNSGSLEPEKIERPKNTKPKIEEVPSSKKDTNKVIGLEYLDEECQGHQKSPNKKGKKKTCPICKHQFVKNGFFMHVNKCKRFKDWKCDWCGTGILTFAPAAAVRGPKGPFTLCQNCGRTYKKNLQLEKEFMSDKEVPKRKQLPQRNRKPVNRLNPSPQTKGCDNVQDDTDTDISFMSTSTRQSIREEKKAKESSRDEDYQKKWGVPHFCKLLLSALDSPKMLFERGPGMWMLSQSKKVAMPSDEFPDSFIQVKWNELIYGDACDDVLNKNIPSQILNVCIVNIGENEDSNTKHSDNTFAKSVSLISAKWKCVPEVMAETKINENTTLSNDRNSGHVVSRSKWLTPSSSVSDSPAYRSLDSAWSEHKYMLRVTIEKVLKESKPVAPGDLQKDVIILTNDEEITTSTQNQEKQGTAKKVVTHAVMTKKSYLVDGDPRPHPKCCWCGPKLKHSNLDNVSCSQYESLTQPACSACKYLYNLGWRLHAYYRKQKNNDYAPLKQRTLDYKYTDELDNKYRSLKSFLTSSTKLVAQAVKDSKIIADSDAEENNSPPKNSTNGDEETNLDEVTLSPCAPKQSTSDENISLQDNLSQKITIRLPTITEILNEEEGLSGILKEDKFRILRSNFGSCMDIAVQALHCISIGQIPHVVELETPFLRPMDEINSFSSSGGPPPTRFIGVSRLLEKKKISNEIFVKFGVEFPAFTPPEYKPNLDQEKNEQLVIPPCATTDKKKVLLRADIDREDMAGKLYSFVYRLLYGLRAAEKIRSQYNSSQEAVDFLKDSLRQFNTKKKIENEKTQ